jgi:hypothetical protein
VAGIWLAEIVGTLDEQADEEVDRPKSGLDRLGSQDPTSGSISRRRAGITCAKLWI